MLDDLSSSELEEQKMYEKLEADLGNNRQRRKEEEQLAREAADRVSKTRKHRR